MVATIIIICIVLFAFLTPIFNTRYNARFMDSYYAKKAPRALALRPLGIFDGGTTRTFSEKGLIKAIAIGVGAEDYDGRSVSLGEGLESYYQPMLKIGDPIEKRAGKKITLTFNGKIDTYLEVGFMYLSLEQAEYQRIVQWERITTCTFSIPWLRITATTPTPRTRTTGTRPRRMCPCASTKRARRRS